MVRKPFYWSLTLLLCLAAFLCAFTAPRAAFAMPHVAGGSVTPQCNVIYWLYANGYSQVELLDYSWKEMHYLRWTPDSSTAFKMRWRNGKTQTFTLRQPGKNLRQVSFFCRSEGFINLQVTDCLTKQPLYNALISDSTGKQFRGFPTKKDGWGVVPCNCNGRLPQKVTIKVSRSGYQTATGKMLFSDKAINRYRICLNKSAPAASKPTFIGQWHGWTQCTNPANGKKPFSFTISKSGQSYVCDDHSGQNKFKPGYLTQSGQTTWLVCPWARSQGHRGVYYWRMDPKDPKLLHGREDVQGLTCKSYNYQMRKVK